MEEKTPEVQKSGWCTCCDGKDPNCTCFHHGFRGGKAIKILFVLIILGLVFSAGIGVGKRISVRRGGGVRGYQWEGGWGNYGRMPMMQYPGWYQQGYNGQWGPGMMWQAVPSATSTAPSVQQK